MKNPIRIGTRGSALAMYQAEMVRTLIIKDFPLASVEIIKVKTSGDMIRRGARQPFETKRIFTKEIEEALLACDIDLGVHSAKDMGVQSPEGLRTAAVLEREDPRDCLISKDGQKLSELPLGARIGTGSLRRGRQLLRKNPELVIEEVRGNVETRIRKMQEGLFDALVLAYAGIKRLGFLEQVCEIFSEATFYPAAGQGIIAVQCRKNDEDINEIVECLHHEETGTLFECEWSFLESLGGGCQLPCGISTELKENQIKARGGIFAVDENKWAETEVAGNAKEPRAVGRLLAGQILGNGGQEILEKISEHFQKE